MPANIVAAVAYIRAGSAANGGLDQDSDKQQFNAVSAYAAGRFEIAATFFEAAADGADPIYARPGFVRLLDYCGKHGIGVVLVATAWHFVCDLNVQLTGHELLR